jgi:hypothetical protein
MCHRGVSALKELKEKDEQIVFRGEEFSISL